MEFSHFRFHIKFYSCLTRIQLFHFSCQIPPHRCHVTKFQPFPFQGKSIHNGRHVSGVMLVPLSHQIQLQPCHVNRNSAISVSCQFRQKRVMFKWNSAISVFISNSKKRLSCLMRIQLLCFHARYNLNIVMVSEIQPFCAFKSNPTTTLSC